MICFQNYALLMKTNEVKRYFTDGRKNLLLLLDESLFSIILFIRKLFVPLNFKIIKRKFCLIF
jgi:hypothetical protein